MNRPSNFSTTFGTDTQSGTVTVEVHGEFESATVPSFEAATGRVVDLDPPSVVLDLEGTELIDSAAIGAIMRFRRDLQAIGTELIIQAPHDYQQRLFEITGLRHILAPD